VRLEGTIKKGWGREEIWATNDKYCGKFMHFDGGKRFSMHFHAVKDETWIVQSGQFLVRWIDTTDATIHERELHVGDTHHNPPLVPHQLFCIMQGTVIEVSTADSVEDNYRVIAGDSQK
jgi:mannose-6-phosphate isomerase-like protein (cupin superfamily)